MGFNSGFKGLTKSKLNGAFFYLQLSVSTVDSFPGHLGILAPPFVTRFSARNVLKKPSGVKAPQALEVSNSQSRCLTDV